MLTKGLEKLLNAYHKPTSWYASFCFEELLIRKRTRSFCILWTSQNNFYRSARNTLVYEGFLKINDKRLSWNWIERRAKMGKMILKGDFKFYSSGIKGLMWHPGSARLPGRWRQTLNDYWLQHQTLATCIRLLARNCSIVVLMSQFFISLISPYFSNKIKLI